MPTDSSPSHTLAYAGTTGQWQLVFAERCLRSLEVFTQHPHSDLDTGNVSPTLAYENTEQQARYATSPGHTCSAVPRCKQETCQFSPPPCSTAPQVSHWKWIHKKRTAGEERRRMCRQMNKGDDDELQSLTELSSAQSSDKGYADVLLHIHSWKQNLPANSQKTHRSVPYRYSLQWIWPCFSGFPQLKSTVAGLLFQ